MKTKKQRIIFSAMFVILTAAAIISCHNEPDKPKPSIESLKFAENKKEMMVGDRAQIALTINPKEARTREKVVYSATGKDIIKIDEENSSNEGVVIEAVGAGNVVITARAGGIVEYCDITVQGDNEEGIPYIALTDSVLEIPVGKKKHILASLQAGVPSDQSNFMFSGGDDSIVLVEFANNSAVIEGVGPGSTRITVSHPKAQYSVDIVVFVVREGEMAKYITSTENVVFMELGDAPRDYSVRLVGVELSEINYCLYQVVEGQDKVSVKGSGESCTIEALKEGVAKVRVTNQAVEYPFEFQVVVSKQSDLCYITADSNFYIINSGIISVNVYMEGKINDDYINNFTYEVDNQNIIEVTQSKNTFFVRGLTNGNAKLTVNNAYSEYPCEILFVSEIQGSSTTVQDVFIKTSQQVIQMELGGPDAILKMELAGGNEADKNNFEWVVEDSSIISAVAPGTVRYNRAQLKYDPVIAEAIITAKKVGTSKITVYNSPKAVNEVNVLVKVYPKGTFYGNAISLSGPNIIWLKVGEEREVYTPVVGGKQENLGTTVWSSNNESVASITGYGLFGMITGISPGVTQVKSTGDSIVHEWESVVVVYNEGEEYTIPYIYTNDVHFDIPVGQTLRIPIYHPNISNSDFNMAVYNTNKESVYYIVSGSVILVSGAQMGQSEIMVSTGIPGCNDLTLYINVVDDKIDIDHPYILTGNNFIGLSEGAESEYKVNMAGANAKELNNIVWSVDDNTIVNIVRSSGDTVAVRGIRAGQTVLRINHMASANEKAVVVYVVEAGKNQATVIVLGIEKSNYVINPNQSIFLRLITNATDEQKKDFRWQNSDDSIIALEDNFDKALVMGLKEGNVKITVTDVNRRHLIDLDIYITVKSESVIDQSLGYPDSIIIVKNQNKILKGNAINISVNELRDITYTFEYSSYVGLIGQGLEVTLRGIAKGQTYLAVQAESINYYKKILVICVDSEDELDNLHYFTVSTTLYRIKKGESLNINLKFGTSGFPEIEKPFITWKNTVSGDAVTIAPSGSKATIVGAHEGIAVIEITSRITVMTVTVTVEVVENVKGSDFYWFMYAPIHQMSVAAVNMMPISIYYGIYYYEDEEGNLAHGKEMENGYSYITLTNDNPSVIEAAMTGSQLRIHALQPGRAVITLSHELIQEDARILVVAYEGDVPPAADDIIIFAPKTHYMINRDEIKTIKLETNVPDLPAKNIIWNNSRSPDIVELDLSDRLNAQVQGKTKGSAEITVEYQNKVYETIFVSVSDYSGNMGVSAATESIIVLSMDDGNYATRIVISGGSGEAVYWTVQNESIVMAAGNGTFALLYPQSAGITELTVKGIGFEKKIIVKVVENEEQKMNTSLLNIDQRFFRIKKGESITVAPYYKIKKPASQAEMVPVYNNNVITSTFENNSFTVFGKNIGIEHVIIKNSQCENEIELVFEVSEEITGSVGNVKSLTFMTIDNPVIRLEPGYSNYYLSFKLIGEYLEGMSDFTWKTNNKNISVNTFGTSALITAGSELGPTLITVENKNYCAQDLEIVVIVGPTEQNENISTPYLYTPKTVYTMIYGEAGIVIPLEIRNAGMIVWSALNYYSEKQYTNIRLSNGNLLVDALTVGTDIIHLSYPSLGEISIYVIIANPSDNAAVYLTTSQNYIIVNQNAAQIVEISMINYEEPDASKITWTSGNTHIAYIVGSGKTVQVMGIATGITKITAHHDKAFNDLEIIVKVIPLGSSEKVCYLTTSENVIETYLTGSGGQLVINKIGGIFASFNASWTVEDPTVASVMGNGSTAYYTPKKAGITKVTVSENEAGTLSIIIIVRNVRPGSQYISTNTPLVLFSPGTTNNVVQVYLSDSVETDEKDFKWIIYSQLPSNADIATEGHNVIDIYAMGSRASISARYAGTARIKVTHPKAAEALFIVVRVSYYSSLSFGQPEIDIVAGDMSFVTVQTPEWENFTQKIQYSSAGAGICSVLKGASRAALLSAQSVGQTEITAFIPGTDLKAIIKVNVIPEVEFNKPEILTRSTTYVLTPHEEPFIIDAQIMGVGITEQDQELLEWRVKGMENNKSSPMIKIYPQIEETETENGINYYRPYSKGRMIQVEVQNRSYNTTEDCTIEITCPSLTNRKRTIYLTVREDTNAFKVSKKEIKLETHEMVELSCNLLGGKNSDYEEVIWQATRDSIDPLKKIVDILGHGKSVQIMGMSDGKSTVTAMYRNLSDKCEVTVKSSNYFNITVEHLQYYPGQRIYGPESADHGGILYVEYEVRPVTAHIEWLNTDTDYLNPVARVNYGAAKLEGETGIGKIYIEPLKQGTFTIMGIAGHMSSKVQVVVKEHYDFNLQAYSFYNTPYQFGKDLLNNEKKPVGPERDEQHSVKYFITPYEGMIRIKSYQIDGGTTVTSDTGTNGKSAQRKLMDEGFEILIKPALPQLNDMRGTGSIVIKNTKETKSFVNVEFELIRPDGSTSNLTQSLNIYSRYLLGQSRLVPVFESIYVNHSGKGLANSYPGNPPSGHYPKGEVYTYGKYLQEEKSGSLQGANAEQNRDNNNDTYKITVGDGEEFYILLDKINKDAYVKITHINGFNISENDIIKDLNNKLYTIKSGNSFTRGMEAQLVTLENGNRAIRVTGGKDYIAFNSFGSEFDLKVDLSSKQPHDRGTPDLIPAGYVEIHLDDLPNGDSISLGNWKTGNPLTCVAYDDYSDYNGPFDTDEVDFKVDYLEYNSSSGEYELTIGKLVHGFDPSGTPAQFDNFCDDNKWVVPKGAYVKNVKIPGVPGQPNTDKLYSYKKMECATVTSDPGLLYYEEYRGYELDTYTRSGVSNNVYYNRVSNYDYGYNGAVGNLNSITESYDYYDIGNDKTIVKTHSITYRYTNESLGYNQGYHQVQHINSEYGKPSDSSHTIPTHVTLSDGQTKPAYIKTIKQTPDGKNLYRHFILPTVTSQQLQLYYIKEGFIWGTEVVERDGAHTTWKLLGTEGYSNNNIKMQPMRKVDETENVKSFGLSPYTVKDEYWKFKTPEGSVQSGYITLRELGGFDHQNGRLMINQEDKPKYLANIFSGRILKFKNTSDILPDSDYSREFNKISNEYSVYFVSGYDPSIGAINSISDYDNQIKDKYSYVQIHNPRYERRTGSIWTKKIYEINKFPFGLAFKEPDSRENIQYERDNNLLINIFKEKYDTTNETIPKDQYMTVDNAEYRYFPVASDNISTVHTGSSTIEIRYATSHSDENYLNIVLEYEVRQCPAMYKPGENTVEYKSERTWKVESGSVKQVNNNGNKIQWNNTSDTLSNITVPSETSFDGKVYIPFEY